MCRRASGPAFSAVDVHRRPSSMLLDPAAYRSSLLAMGPPPARFVPPPAEYVRWLTAKPLPAAIAEFLAGNALAVNVPFPTGTGGVWGWSDVIALNDQEGSMLAAGLLAIGNTTNGDFIVIDLRPEVDRAGIVSHDELWETRPVNVRSIYAPVDRSIHAMLAAMAAEWNRWRADDAMRFEGLRYPVDYSSALQLGPGPADGGDT